MSADQAATEPGEQTIAEQLEQIHLTLRDVVQVLRLQTELLTCDPVPAAATEAPSVPAPRGRRRHLYAVPDLAPEAGRLAR
ncbi:hypothetical protein [Actinomadura opuntiae]|uniref:hypothetical protein n=1 Tax=Actinomadura sp. OS1-43 TaxID=604315 RepID=UPI00255AE745|nr:hypothetical protein [Actinomadura sp. OS1-43]MDL4815465.1 hypothetical protein [Actinomadura sp. OS1-43]